jgi:hypothetical protein
VYRTRARRTAEWAACPWCGGAQPDALAARKRNIHLAITLCTSLPAGLLLVGGAEEANREVSYSLVSLVVSVLAAVGLFAHAVVARWNPNGNVTASRRPGEVVRGAEGVELIAEGRPLPINSRSASTAPGTAIWLVIGVLALPFAAAPFLLKIGFGWPTTPGVKPEVVGSGDTLRVHFVESVEAVGYLWRGDPRARSETWGRDISVQHVNSKTTPRPWVDVTLPDNPNLVGKTVVVKVDMAVTRPVPNAVGFSDVKSTMSVTQIIHVAPAGAGVWYGRSFFACFGGAVFLSVCGLMFTVNANRLSNLAHDVEELKEQVGHPPSSGIS